MHQMAPYCATLAYQKFLGNLVWRQWLLQNQERDRSLWHWSNASDGSLLRSKLTDIFYRITRFSKIIKAFNTFSNVHSLNYFYSTIFQNASLLIGLFENTMKSSQPLNTKITINQTMAVMISSYFQKDQ